MPYIKNEERGWFDTFPEGKYESPGQLNYSITTLIIAYLEDRGECYQTYNDIIGALECAKLEVYRRKVSYYEDGKIRSNGDVY